MVNRIVSFLTLVFQIIAAVLMLFLIWSIFCYIDYQGGVDGLVGLILGQLIFGTIIIGLIIACCLLIGLPIRLVTVLNKWWKGNSWIAIAGIAVGFTLNVIALYQYASEIPIAVTGSSDYYHRPVSNSFTVFTSVGLFVTAFFILHFYPGRFINGMMSRFKNISIKNRRFDSLLGR